MMRRNLQFAAWLVLGLTLLASHSPAQPAAKSLEYRKVFIPQDRISELDKLGQKLTILKRQEFQQYLDTINAAPNDARSSGARLLEAKFQARLDQTDLVEGQAELKIEHAASGALLPLDPCSLAIGAARWSAEIPARLGTDAAGKLAVVVEATAGATGRKTSDLRFDWSLRGARDASGALVFDVQLPACAATRLVLDLPEKLAPSIADGIVTKGELVAGKQDRRLWMIEFGGQAQTTLSLAPADQAAGARPRAIVSQTTVYELSPEALEANFELRVNVEDEPLAQLAIDFDAALQLTALRLGDAPLVWTQAVSADKTRQRAVIEFANPLVGHDRVLKIAALARIERDKHWRLPTLLASDVLWQDGSMTLVVPATFELGSLTPQQARQTKATTSAAGESTHQFQCLASDSSLGVVVRHRSPQLRVNEGLTLKWDGPHLTAQLVSELSANEGATFECRASVGPGWIIDSLESTPPGRIENWTQSNVADRSSAVEIRLAKAVSRDNPLQLSVIAHRRAPLRNERLQPPDYRVLDWQQLHSRRRLVAVQTEAQQQLALAGDANLQRLDPRALSAADKKLVDPSSRLLFLDASVGPSFALALRAEAPRFAAETATQFKLGRDWLSELHTIRVAPDSSLSRLVVRFSAAPPRPVQWKLEEPAGIVARQLASDEGELWELSFARPQAQAFTVVAERQTTLRAGDPARVAPLVSVLDAEAQTSDITIDVLEGATPLIEQRGLTPVMWNETSAPTRAKFRYQPASDQQLTIAHAVGQQSLPALFAWNRRLISRIDGSGEVAITAYYQLENAGASAAILQIPDTAELRQVRVEGTRLAPTPVQGELTIPLPTEVRYPTLQVEYALPRGEQFGLTRELLVLAPSSEFPILAHETQQWISPEWDWVADEIDWRTRLFGPLARGPSAPRSLFSWQSWREQFTGQQLTDGTEQQAALALAALEQTLASARNWGEWAQAYNLLAADNARLPVLQIDAPALARIRVYHDTELDAPQSAKQVLRTLGVDLITSGERIIATSWERRRQSQAQATRSPSIYHLPFGAEDQVEDVLDVAVWQAEPQPARAAWRVEGRSSLMDLEAAGWRGRTFDSPARHPVSLSVCRWQSLQAIAWGVFLCAVGVGWLLARRSLWAFLLLLLVLTALWVPAPWVTLATAALLGLLLGGMVGALVIVTRRAEPPRTSDPPPPSTIRFVRQPAAVAGALLIVWLCWERSQAQEPRDTAPIQRVAEVYFPVDAEQKPTDIVYVPEDFYAAIVRQARLAKAAPQGWMLYDAAYRGEVRNAVASKLQFSELSASYDLEVFQANTRVSLALARDEVHLLENGVTLEGRPLRIDWLENGSGFTFDVAAAGRYRLDLSLRPVTRVAGDREQATLKLPRVHRSRLALKAPVLSKGLQVAGAVGHSPPAVEGSWDIDVGPASTLSVYWPAEGEPKAGKEVEAMQLLWWHIRPGAVTLESQWKFKSSAEPLTDIRLVTDPRLRLLPLKVDQPVAEHTIREGEVQAIHFALKQPYEREVTLQASFSLVGAAGVGNLQLPKLDAVVDRTTSRMVGISVSPELHIDVATADSATAREFAAAWKSQEVPAAAYKLVENAEPLTLSIAPREVQVTARQALTFAVDDARQRAELEALIQVSGGTVYQHPLEIPAGWDLEAVQLFEGNVEKSVTAVAGVPGSYTAFINGGLQGEHRLVVRASSPFVPRSAWTLPPIRLGYSSVAFPTVFLERTSAVGLEIIDNNGYEPLPGAELTADGAWRRVAVLRPTGDSARQIILKLERADVKVTAEQLISVMQQGESWQAVVEVRGSAAGETLETLRFDAPAELTNLRLNVEGKLDVFPLAGTARQQIVVSLAQPVRGDFSVRLTAPLAATTVDRLQVPDVRLLDVEGLDTFVALPSSTAEQQLTWNTRGLQSLSAAPPIASELSAGMLYFSAPAGRFQALVRRLERFAGVPQVRLADVVVKLGSDGGYFGVAAFDLEPAGLHTCTVQMPTGGRMAGALVAGKVAIARSLGDGRYEIQLHHEQLPQHLEVAFAMPSTGLAHSEDRELACPTLATLPVERTLWTVYPAPQSQLELLRDEERIEPARAASLRLKNAGAALQYAANHSFEGQNDIIRAWFRSWSRQQAQLDAALGRGPLKTDALLAEQETLAADAQSLAENWGVPQALDDAAAKSRTPSNFRDVAGSMIEARESVTAMLPGAAGDLAIKVQPRLSIDLLLKVTMSTLALAGFAIWLRYRHLLALRDFLARFPYVPIIALGIAWWLWLSPALVGLLISTVFAVASLRMTASVARRRSAF